MQKQHIVCLLHIQLQIQCTSYPSAKTLVYIQCWDIDIDELANIFSTFVNNHTFS